jgi:predicted lipoprotein with Yx(FWY)xxD motif
MEALRLRPAAIALVIGLAVATSVASAATSAVTVVHSAQNSSLGVRLLVAASGRTLYHDGSEKKNVVKCVGPCAVTWTPLLVSPGAKPAAGPGVTASLLGIVKRPDGKLQVTYAGLPLYLYTGDTKAGDVKGQGEGGIWHALTPSGTIVSKAVKTSTGSTGGSTGSTGTSGSTGSTGSGSTSGSGSGSTSGSGSNTGGSGNTGGGTNCATDPGGYGCM